MPHSRLHTVRRQLCLVTCLAFAAVARPSAAADPPETWPQWRGPQRTGFVAGPTWPETLKDEHLKLQWRVPLGPSYSGPIVMADRVFVTETKDKTTETVRALDRETGRELWSASWPGALAVPFMAKRNGDWIRSTPACDGESLYVAGMRDVLVCLNVQTGQERWRVDFVDQLKTPLPSFGCVCSPLVVGEHLYIQAGASSCKLDKRTGKIIWRTLGDGGAMLGSAFSSPVLTRLCGQEQVLFQTRQKLAGVDPETGTVLWSQEIATMLGMNILTPTVVGDSIFTTAYGGVSLLLNIRREDNKYRVETAWKNPVQGYMSTPIVIGGRAYLHLRNQRFTCLDLATGKQAWTTEAFGEYWSLVAQQDRLLALDQRGELRLIRANAEKFDLLDTRKISEQETWGHLAVCGDQVLVRELNGLAVYRWR